MMEKKGLKWALRAAVSLVVCDELACGTEVSLLHRLFMVKLSWKSEV